MNFQRPTNRRQALGLAAAGVAAAYLPAAAQAQAAWPARPIKLIVPYAAGGGTDVIARAVATKLGAALGQPMVVDNRLGAGGNIGNDAVAKAPPDGYTLLFATSSTVINLPSVKLPYDLMKDFATVGQIGATPTALMVPQDSPIKSMRELLDQARARPNALSYGSAGIGSFAHLATEMIFREAKVQLTHVPYKGTAPAFADLMGGNLTVVIASFASARSLMEGGKLRALVVTSAQRSSLAPGVPTLTEVGLPGSTVELWWGLMAPAGTPAGIIQRINRELNTALAEPDMREQLLREAGTPTPGTPEAFGRLYASEVERWARTIREAGIKGE